ncbi:MAG: hypothetical protein PHS24_03440 [Bacilli bacterium]|nr:hypothetical protein [Bacilli bacterium]
MHQYSSYLADTISRNDKSIISGNGYGINTTYYGSYDRINTSLSPNLICPNDFNGGKLSKFTAHEAYSNRDLDYKIDLLTAEVSFSEA